MTYNVIRFYFNGLTALFWNMSTYRYCSATHARRFHINSEYGGCPRDVGWLTVVDSDPPDRCGWETNLPLPQFLYSKSKTVRNWNLGWFFKKMKHLIIIGHVFICLIFISVFQFFLYRWHWVCGYACDFCSNIAVRVVKLHTLIKSKHNSVKDINHLQSQNTT